VNCPCREGTGDMRAAHMLTWSFDGSSSFFFTTTSEPTPCVPHLFTRVTTLHSRKQPHGQPANAAAGSLPYHVIDAWRATRQNCASTRSASVPALINLTDPSGSGRLIISIFVCLRVTTHKQACCIFRAGVIIFLFSLLCIPFLAPKI
jgi:hypothetical protein